MRPTRQGIGFACALGCLLAIGLPGTARGRGVGLASESTDVGALTARVEAPFESKYFFTTDRLAYPAYGERYETFQSAAPDEDWLVHVGPQHFDDGGSFVDEGDALSDTAGTFWANAQLEDWVYAYAHGYDGVLSDCSWARWYRKDAEDAQLSFTVSQAYLQVYVLGGDARAEFSFDVMATEDFDAGPYWTLHQHAGLQGAGGNNQSWEVQGDHGDMTYTTSEPLGYGSKRLDFAPYTGVVDLSGIPVGQEFYVEYAGMALAWVGPGEVTQAWAFLRDPVSLSGGFEVEATGLTVVPEPGAGLAGAAALTALGLQRGRRAPAAGSSSGTGRPTD
jgi:hypothetical protein